MKSSIENVLKAQRFNFNKALELYYSTGDNVKIIEPKHTPANEARLRFLLQSKLDSLSTSENVSYESLGYDVLLKTVKERNLMTVDNKKLTLIKSLLEDDKK